MHVAVTSCEFEEDVLKFWCILLYYSSFWWNHACTFFFQIIAHCLVFHVCGWWRGNNLHTILDMVDWVWVDLLLLQGLGNAPG